MGKWGAASATKVLKALLRIGWREVRRNGSHRTLVHADGRRFTFAFHDGESIGPKMLARIGKHTGLQPDDV